MHSMAPLHFWMVMYLKKKKKKTLLNIAETFFTNLYL